MPDDKKANGSTPNEGENEVDLTKYIGKEDHDKEISAKDTELSKAKEDLDTAKMSLLDADYIEYLESKKAKPEDDADDKDAKDAGLPSKVEFDAMKKELGMTKAAVEDVLAVIELKNTEERYPDFKDYRDDIKAIIESSRATLTFEQAYKIAKASKPADKKDDPTKPLADSEKPSGSVPGDGLEKKDFKDADEAGEDAWNKSMGPGKDSL